MGAIHNGTMQAIRTHSNVTTTGVTRTEIGNNSKGGTTGDGRISRTTDGKLMKHAAIGGKQMMDGEPRIIRLEIGTIIGDKARRIIGSKIITKEALRSARQHDLRQPDLNSGMMIGMMATMVGATSSHRGSRRDQRNIGMKTGAQIIEESRDVNLVSSHLPERTTTTKAGDQDRHRITTTHDRSAMVESRALQDLIGDHPKRTRAGDRRNLQVTMTGGISKMDSRSRMGGLLRMSESEKMIGKSSTLTSSASRRVVRKGGSTQSRKTTERLLIRHILLASMT